MTISIERCRELLGSDAHGQTDDEIQRLVDGVSKFASVFCDFIHDAWKRDPDAVRSVVQARAAKRNKCAEGERSRSQAT